MKINVIGKDKVFFYDESGCEIVSSIVKKGDKIEKVLTSFDVKTSKELEHSDKMNILLKEKLNKNINGSIPYFDNKSDKISLLNIKTQLEDGRCYSQIDDKYIEKVLGEEHDKKFFIFDLSDEPIIKNYHKFVFVVFSESEGFYVCDTYFGDNKHDEFSYEFQFKMLDEFLSSIKTTSDLYTEKEVKTYDVINFVENIMVSVLCEIRYCQHNRLIANVDNLNSKLVFVRDMLDDLYKSIKLEDDNYLEIILNEVNKNLEELK